MNPDLRASVFALAFIRPDLITVEPRELVITDHSVSRYQERVEAVPEWLARRRLRELVTTARWRSRPDPGSGLLLYDDTAYGYSERRPEVCLVARDGALRTVLVPVRIHIPAQRRAGQ